MPKPLLRMLGHGLVGVVLALPLEVLWHLRWPTLSGLWAGVLGAVLPPLILGPIWADLPRFLRRGLDLAAAVAGVVAASMLVILSEGWLYSLLHRGELLAGLVSLGLLTLAIASQIETHRQLAAVIEDRERQLAEARRAELEAQLRALQAQIQPHFLFNTFNALAELIHVDADRAETLVTDLAAVLRYSLRASATAYVPLSEELEVVVRTLRIAEARLGDRLRVHMPETSDWTDVAVPGLLVQPLVENAVRYGVAARAAGGEVRVGVERDGDGLRITVEDDGPGLSLDALAKATGTGGHGGGVANVRRRLELSYGARGRLHHDTPQGGGTRWTLSLPAETP